MSIGKLSKIEIAGFKSIKACELELHDINVLIGSNGAGKSNFISVFSLLKNILAKNLELYAAQIGINSLFYNGRKITNKIVMEFTFGKDLYAFELIPTNDNRIVIKEDFVDSENQDIGFTVAQNETDLEGLLEDYAFSRVASIINSDNWRVYHFHDTSRNANVKLEHNISNSKALLFDAANLAAFLYRLKKHYKSSYKQIIDTIRIIAPFFDDFDLEPNEGNNEKIILRWKQRGCEDIFNVSQLSDGTLRFMCLATLLLQPRELLPATIIIDEPELGLHPYAITIFAEMVKQISATNQIIISTQSIELLNEFEAEDVVVVDRDENGSVFKRLNSEKLQDWIDNDYTLGELWNKNILGGRLSK